jgi:YVTN family beta-propeller protein
MTQDAQQPPGIDIPGYETLGEAGRGGFGVVLRARQVAFNRTVAIKVLSGSQLDERTRSRFDRECRALGALSGHPNILHVHDSGFTSDGRPYIVMDFMPGGSFAERLEAQGPLPWQEAGVIGVKLAGALETAHRSGVLHRDLKPENVLVSTYGEPVLGDFGIARVAGGPETRTGLITASVAHAAPEILSGQRPSVAADVYSLASTIVTLILGRPAFLQPTDESLVPMIARISTDPIPDLRQQGVPDGIAAVLEKAMSKDPADRYASAADFGRDLRDALSAAGVSAPDMVLTPAPETATPPAPESAAASSTGEVSPPRPPEPPAPAPASQAPTPPDLDPADRTRTVAPISGAVAGPPSAPAPPPPPSVTPPSVSPAPAPVVGFSPPGAVASPPPLKARDTLGVVLLVVGAVAAVGLVVTAFVVRGGGGEAASVRGTAWVANVFAGTITSVDRATGREGETVRIGDDTIDQFRDGDTIWVIDNVGEALVAVDANSGKKRETFELSAAPNAVVVADGSVWVSFGEDDIVQRISPRDGDVEEEIDVGDEPFYLAVGGGSVWVSESGDGSVSRIDTSQNEVTETIEVGSAPRGMAFSQGELWVANSGDGTIQQIDIRRNEAKDTVKVGDGPEVIAATATDLWVVNSTSNTVSRVDRRAKRVTATVNSGLTPISVAATEDQVWVSNIDDDTLVRINPDTNRIDLAVEVADGPGTIVLTGDGT